MTKIWVTFYMNQRATCPQSKNCFPLEPITVKMTEND